MLIDEIDKADIDFPNDLLLELEKRKFIIPELGERGEIEATSEVLVFITSNQEKELPPAFLRRCLYHYIPFPDTKNLEKIVEIRFDKETDTERIKKAVAIFEKVRNKIEGINKKPATSELLDWYQMIYDIATLKPENHEQKALLRELADLGTEKIPFKQILLKNYESFLNTKIDKDAEPE